PAGRGDLGSQRRGHTQDRRRAVRRGDAADGRRAGTARVPLARRSAGDHPVDRSAGRRRPESQGAVPRQGRVDRRAVPRTAGGGGGAIVQTGDYIYLSGQGATPQGDRPFVDRLNLKTLQSDRIFRSAPDALETFVAPLSDDMSRFLTRSESPKDPPNYFARNRDTTTKRPLTEFKDPQPQLRGVEHQFVTYKRKDGVMLSATLYTPPGYKKGDHVPVI